MIPEGWDTYELGDLAEFKSGGTPSKQNDSYWGGAFPWVSAKDLKSHLITKAELGLTASGELQANVAPVESILVLVRGMTLLKDVPIGLVKRRVAFNQDIKALITNAHVDPLFLSYFLVLQKKTMMALVNTANHGTGRLDTELLRGLMILLPPLPEQRRIADILSTWDRAIETVKALITNTRAQKKALMQSLLTGKHRLPGFSGPWTEMTLNKIAKVTMGSSPPSTSYNELGEGLPLIQGNADIKSRVSAPRVHTSLITQRCLPDDILFSVRAPVGEIAKSLHHACIGRGIAAIQARSSDDAEFLYHVLLFAEPSWAKLSQGSTFQAVNSKDLKGFTFPAPVNAIERQQIGRLVAEAQEAELLLQAQLITLCQEKSALMQQLLTGKRRVKVAKREAM